VLVINGSGTLDRGRYHRCRTRRLDAEDRDPSGGRDVDVERYVVFFSIVTPLKSNPDDLFSLLSNLFLGTVNSMVDQLSAFASEVTRVALEVGTQGILGGQAKVEGVQGTWADLTRNVNVGRLFFSLFALIGFSDNMELINRKWRRI